MNLSTILEINIGHLYFFSSRLPALVKVKTFIPTGFSSFLLIYGNYLVRLEALCLSNFFLKTYLPFSF